MVKLNSTQLNRDHAVFEHTTQSRSPVMCYSFLLFLHVDHKNGRPASV